MGKPLMKTLGELKSVRILRELFNFINVLADNVGQGIHSCLTLISSILFTMCVTIDLHFCIE